SGGRSRLGSGADRAERVLVSDDGVRGFDLFGQRQGRSRGRGRELVGVDDLLKLWAERVERTAERGDEDERADEDSRIEVESAQERTEPWAGGSVSVAFGPGVGVFGQG